MNREWRIKVDRGVTVIFLSHLRGGGDMSLRTGIKSFVVEIKKQ